MTPEPTAAPEPAEPGVPARGRTDAPRRRPPDQSEIRGISTIASLPPEPRPDPRPDPRPSSGEDRREG